ncbi:site-specific integrase [Sphingobium sufflavum]|uniref:tyrosine-type recombinase/integrase n=1 Tax=Sphingobium sufflavum TaxID=1129547 RepID=UPI001F47EEEB|nr:site-specific integrase [Sphingobium sufflavum]MCE7798702.1 site-specific integrase [Sphingobium sufflavum]
MLKAGHPAIWKDGKLFEEACRWLNNEIVPIKPSPKTWAQAAQSLLTWLDFLEAAEVDWQFAGQADLVAYRDAYLGAISPQTGKEYSANTIAVRMTYIIDFICFAVEHDWIDSDLRVGPIAPLRQSNRAPIDKDALAHIRKGSGGPKGEDGVGAVVRRLNKLKPRSGQDDTVRTLSREDLTALLRWAGPRPSERKPGDGGSDRDFIVFALGWACGLRVQEIADVNVLSILGITASSEVLGQMHKLLITGKRMKTRLIDVPTWLVLDLQAYIEGERKRALRKRGPRVEEKQLILNSEYSTRTGKPMTKSAMQDLVERACLKIGLINNVKKVNPETGEVVVAQTPKYSMHCLRHTYTVMTYHNHRKSGYAELDAWKYVQMQLGHKSPTTTINTYLNHLSVWADYRAGRSLLQMVR